MAKEQQIYQVTFHETLVVVERVWATSKSDAIRQVKDGEGERLSEMVDEFRYPFGHKAEIQEE